MDIEAAAMTRRTRGQPLCAAKFVRKGTSQRRQQLDVKSICCAVVIEAGSAAVLEVGLMVVVRIRSRCNC